MKKTYLTSMDQLENINDLPIIDKFIKDWGITVRIKKLSIAQFMFISKNNKSDEDYYYRIIASSLVDDEGERFINNNDAEKLSERSAMGLKEIFEAIQELNGLTKSANKRKEDLESDPFLSPDLS